MFFAIFPFFDIFFDNQVVTLSRDVPGERSLSRDFCCCSCPGTKGQRDKETFLSWDKGTTGRPVPDCPRTSCGTSHLLETLIQTKQDRKGGMLVSAMIKAGLSCNHYMIFCYNNDSITLLP